MHNATVGDLVIAVIGGVAAIVLWALVQRLGSRFAASHARSRDAWTAIACVPEGRTLLTMLFMIGLLAATFGGFTTGMTITRAFETLFTWITFGVGVALFAAGTYAAIRSALAVFDAFDLRLNQLSESDSDPSDAARPDASP